MSDRYVGAGLAAGLLVALLLLVLTMAKYAALVEATRAACEQAAAPLDLSSWVPLCRQVMPEDLERAR